MKTWSRVGETWATGEAEGATFTWYHLCEPGDGELEALAARFQLHPLAVEDCRSTSLHTPKVDEFDDHLFLVFVAVVAPAQGSTEPAVEEFDAFLAPTFLITHTDTPIPEVEAVLDLLRDDRRLRPGSDGLLYEIIDRIVDGILPEVGVIASQLDAIEDEVLRAPERAGHSREIVRARAAAGHIRRLLAPQMAVVLRLARGEFACVHEANRVYFRDIYDHLMRVDLALEAVREDAEVVLSTYLSALNNRMNEVMKVLSVVAALALPATVISGIFGTNFDDVPGLHTSWGFAGMLVLMAGVAVSMALFFRRRGWF